MVDLEQTLAKRKHVAFFKANHVVSTDPEKVNAVQQGVFQRNVKSIQGLRYITDRYFILYREGKPKCAFTVA